MHPEDTVLVGVMEQPRDFEIAQKQGWYRIREGQAKKALNFTYVAFFFGRKFKKEKSAIRYYARITGHELATRAELLPDDCPPKKANQRYYKLQIRDIRPKDPPILNDNLRFAFIYTTWDRFINATMLKDLYSRDDYLVDRVFYALEEKDKLKPSRRWQLENPMQYPSGGAQVRVLCEKGEVVASTLHGEGVLIDDDLESTLARIRAEIRAKGGPLMLQTPLE